MTRTEIKAASSETLDARWRELRTTCVQAIELSYVAGERARLELDDVERELRHRVQMEYNAANHLPCVPVSGVIGIEPQNQWCATCAAEHEFPAVA